MVDEAKSAAGKKGAAIRAAKKKAAEENNAVVLHEYKIIVFPDGQIEAMTPGDMTGEASNPTEAPVQDDTDTHGSSTESVGEGAPEPAEEPPGEPKPGLYAVGTSGVGFMIGERMPDGSYVHHARAATDAIVNEFMQLKALGFDTAKAIDHLNNRHGDGTITGSTTLLEPSEETEPYDPEESHAGDDRELVDDDDNFIPPEPARTTPPIIDDTAAVDKTAPALPDTVLARANYYVEYNGLSEDDAVTLASSQIGRPGAMPRGPDQPGAPGEGETLGPDKNMIAAYKDRMKTYVKPKLDVMISVENPDGDDWTYMMPLRFLDYLLRSSQWETIKRRREVNPADRLQMILREFRRDDQEVKLLMTPGSATGPAGTFNPAQGGWAS